MIPDMTPMDFHPSNLNNDETIIILDTETTGLDHKTEKLIEIAAVKMVNGVITESFTSLVNPQKPIRHSSFLIHNISEEMVKDAPNIEEVLPRFLEFVGDHAYVAHNAIFDYSFINEPHKAIYGKRFLNTRIDTFEMYRSVYPDDPSHGLSSLLRRFGFEDNVLHRALDDTMNLAKVYPRLRDLYEQKNAWQLSQMKNIPYLFERYLRIQKSTQMLQAEMADLKDIFKLYFQNAGLPVEASSGDVMMSNYRRSYSYDEKQIWEIALKANVPQSIFKLNPRALDKLIERSDMAEEYKEEMRECRLSMHESRGVTFVKPQLPVEPTVEISEGSVES